MINAKNKPLNLNSVALPAMQVAILRFLQPMTFDVICQVLIDGYLKENSKYTAKVKACRQPFTDQELAIKPEGDRQWKWEKLHATDDVILNVNDIVIFDVIKYRVMKKSDWKEYGYVTYDIVQDYDGCNPTSA